ncbi:MAG: hypothetical protein U5N86_00160 [Planctomycetota bacterium]|nr:hypothetical protein [Planctomycetota bacterium]
MATDDILTRAEWTERVVAVANNVIDENEDLFTEKKDKSFFEDMVLDRVEAYLKGSAVLHAARYEFVKYCVGAEHTTRPVEEECKGLERCAVRRFVSLRLFRRYKDGYEDTVGRGSETQEPRLTGRMTERPR